MVRIDFTEPFPCSAQQAYDVATTDFPDIVDYVPNVDRLITLERVPLEHGRERGLYEFHARSPLPPPLSGIIRPEMLRWRQTLVYDPARRRLDWSVEPAVFPGHIHCHGVTQFLDRPPGGSTVHVTGALRIDTLPIPAFPDAFLIRISRLLESVAGRLIEPNLRQFYQAIKKLAADRGLL